MKTVDPKQLKKLATPIDEIIIIDIREPSEYAREHIPGSINIPLNQLTEYDTTNWQDKTVLFHCKSGNRTKQAQILIDKIPHGEKLCLSGGIEEWKLIGNDVLTNKEAPLELMRQVQIIAGSMVLLGVLLAYLISPYFIILTIIAGIGLLNAGITGFCGMAKLLMFLPYNKSTNKQEK